ncbi:integumentary mucin C.1-like [Ochlerotatus camptorhynchus]|uniref:integumentary mucin C.1-like n=1 Tax=Ochlerotatus camptorhynchus TaxID=644619 RepID=UPI0031D438A9
MKTVVVVFALLLAAVSARPDCHENNNRCSGLKDGTRFPNMDDCHKYVECSNEKESQKSCKEHDKFDAVSLKCSDKSGVSCFQVPTTTTTTTEKTTTTKKPTTTTTKKPTTTTTTKHTTTKKPTTTTTKHTTTKKPTTTTTQKPMTTTTKHTTTKKPTTSTAASPITTPVPTCNTRYELNCAMYWSCGTGQPTLESCLDGYIFYEPLHFCLPGDIETCEIYHI